MGVEVKFASSCGGEPADGFVVLKAGEAQRLAKLGSNAALGLPANAAGGDGKIQAKIEVLKTIAMSTIQIDTRADTSLDVAMQCASDHDIGNVRVILTSSQEDAPICGAQSAVDENNYLTEHGIQESLAAAVRAVCRERPGDPRQFIAEYLLSGPGCGPPQPLRTLSKQSGGLPDLAAMAAEIERLRQHCNRQDTMLDDFHENISQLVRDQPLTFTVLEYNILAHYLGNNTEPWLLYGPKISEERRKNLMTRFTQKDGAGKYIYAGWPHYADGVLSKDEIAQVEDINRRIFDWSVRKNKLLEKIQSANSDILALVEMDEYADFAEGLAKDYDGVFRKRPRRSSKDGCAVFWRKSKFELAAFEGFDFVDRRQECGSDLKDRTCVLVLLRWNTHRFGRHESRVLIVCTHLARNPEDASQTKVRARQAAQLMKHLTEFASKHQAGEVPVVLMGDLNAQHFGEVRGIARTVFQVSGHPCHSFLFRCADVPTGPTSVTDVRKVRIDAVMYPPKHLKVLGIVVPELTDKIPDECHPSDHVPVRVKFEVKADHMRLQECARSWLECVTGESRILPMTDKEIKDAYSFFDRDGTSVITKGNLQESILELELGSRMTCERQMELLDCFPNQGITMQEFIDAYEIKFNASRMGNIGDLEQAFLFFDTEKRGKVSADDVRSAFNEIVPIDFTEDEVNCMLSQFGLEWEDGVDVHDFCAAMCRCNFSCSNAAIKDQMARSCSKLRQKLEALSSPMSPRR